MMIHSFRVFPTILRNLPCNANLLTSLPRVEILNDPFPNVKIIIQSLSKRPKLQSDRRGWIRMNQTPPAPFHFTKSTDIPHGHEPQLFRHFTSPNTP